MRLRKSPEGYLYGPNKGRIISCPDGYEPHPQYPNTICIPCLEECEHRELKEVKGGCCTEEKLYCHFFEKWVTVGDCKECK